MKPSVEMLIEKYRHNLYVMAFSVCKNAQDAEDVVQDVLIRYMQSGKVFEDENHVKAWLLRVSANLCKDKLKSASRQREVAIPEGYEAVAAEEEPKGESEVFQAVMALPENLFYFEEYSTAEIASILQKKEAMVRSLLKRGREKIEKMMKGDDGHAKEL